MSSDYRVIRITHIYKDKTWVTQGIHKVWYACTGEVNMYHTRPDAPTGKSDEDLAKDIQIHLDALKKPVIKMRKPLIHKEEPAVLSYLK
jgi:hypothetical protein